MAKKKHIKVTQNYMDSVPIKASDRPWRTLKDGNVEIDMENKGFFNSVAQKFFKRPRVSHIALDRYGSVLWKHIDGKNSVYDIVQAMEREFPDEKDRMLDRVITFMAVLQRNNFISMKNGQ